MKYKEGMPELSQGAWWYQADQGPTSNVLLDLACIVRSRVLTLNKYYHE